MSDFRRPRVPEDLAVRIDEARGDIPFDRWVRRALEAQVVLQGMPSPFISSTAESEKPE